MCIQDNDFVEVFAGDAEVTAKLRQDIPLKHPNSFFGVAVLHSLHSIKHQSLLRRMVGVVLKRGGCCIIALCCESFSAMFLACHLCCIESCRVLYCSDNT